MLLVLGFSSQGLALDESGCLTCHQYPGLTRLEVKGTFTPLHIDEKKFRQSVHGEVRCTQCHTSVSKVPHTGETRVDCTTADCHQGGDAATLLKQSGPSSFHAAEQSFITALPDDSSCRVCHPLYPHSKDQLTRALLNMHTGFMVCSVCHVKKGAFEALAYEWTDKENAEFKGEPFGTFFNPRISQGKTSEHFISRIAVSGMRQGARQDLMAESDQDKAQAAAFSQEEGRLAPAEKERRLTKFHRNVERKAINAACNECHSRGNMAFFENLGFDPLKADHLATLNIKGLVTKYRTFYFPKMFGN